MEEFAMKIAIVLLLAVLPVRAFAEGLTVSGIPVEIAISQVTDRTVRVDIVPLDGAGMPRPAPASTVFMPFKMTEALRVRDAKDLPAGKPLSVGKTGVTVSVNPLTFTFTKAAGKLLQQIAVRDADGAMVFNTAGPTFGLGQGRQQFDRRGFYYNFQNGQNEFLATNGATLPVPFLIGLNTDGDQHVESTWGMFIHNPSHATDNAQQNNQAWGQFD